MAHKLIRTQGFSLLTALFALVVFSSIAAYMVEIGGAQQSSVNLTLIEAKVMAAAESGAEYATARAAQPNCVCNPGTAAFVLTTGGFADTNIAVTTTCTWEAYRESTISYYAYTITSSATYSVFDSPDYVNRRIMINGNDAGYTCHPP